MVWGDDITHMLLPGGPSGQFTLVFPLRPSYKARLTNLREFVLTPVILAPGACRPQGPTRPPCCISGAFRRCVRRVPRSHILLLFTMILAHFAGKWRPIFNKIKKAHQRSPQGAPGSPQDPPGSPQGPLRAPQGPPGSPQSPSEVSPGPPYIHKTPDQPPQRPLLVYIYVHNFMGNFIVS